jgi:peptidoglycan hydrolase-like protein with peptidoglycan-binding domain
MARRMSFVLFFCFLSACATLTEDNGTQAPQTQTVMDPASEIQPESDPATSKESARNESNQSANATRTLSKQEIKSLQAQLKAASFDAGALDGMLGVKTIAAIRRLQSGCTSLKDLMENSDTGIFQQSSRTQSSTSDRIPSTDEIRLIQVRLKEAGFEPGSIDGVMGLKTRSALLRFQSGCAIVKELPASLQNQGQTAERQTISAAASEKRIQPVVTKSPPATDSVRGGVDKVNAAIDKTPSKEEIQLLQKQLKSAGFDPGPFDGVLGPKTNSALQQYRASYGSTPRKVSSGTGLKFDY